MHLSVTRIESLIRDTAKGKRKPQAHPDGGNLYLQVQTSGASWLYRFSHAGKRQVMGLGPFPAISLATARERAQEQRSLVADGVDPVKHRDGIRRARRAATAMTFEAAARRFCAEHAAEWRNRKTAQRYARLMEMHAYPQIGRLPVGEIDLDAALRVLRPIWQSMNFSARRLMFFCRAAIDATRGEAGGLHPDRLNPFAWGGNLKHRLAKPSKLVKEEHHKALGWKQIPSFMDTLRADQGTDARMLEFCVLCVTRSGPVLKMCWPEIDWTDAVWSVPAQHEKNHRPLRVPLTARAVEILEQRRPADAKPDALVWKSERTGGLRSSSTLWRVVQRLNYDCTPHGCRSSFADWRAEQTSFPADLQEAALSHTLGKTQRAYQRGDLFDRRRALMESWGSFCAGDDGGNVVPFRRGRAA